MNGVLVIDKPSGPTSFDVVRRVRSLLKVSKAGHTGTLDPTATGVLPICLEDATKIAGYITEASKAYDAVIRLGVETDTQDAAGKVIAEAPVPPLSVESIEAALGAFRGTFEQTPPMYSAVKVGGKRLYELAREGEVVERKARTVTVHELLLRDFSADELRISVKSSKGFFVRSLAHELGRAMGCGAHLKALRRTASGPFTLAQAVTLDKLMDPAVDARAYVASKLVSVEAALGEMPKVAVTDEQARKVLHGVPLELAGPAPLFQLVSPSGSLLAIAAVENGRVKYRRVFNQGES